MTVLVNFVVALALGVLKTWLARADVQRGERLKIVAEGLSLDNEALAYLVDAAGHPGAAALLRVRAGAGVIDTARLKPLDGAPGARP